MTATEQPQLGRSTISAHQQDRDRLVETHLELAYSVARRFVGHGEESDDLRQLALLALVRAANRFDPTRGFAFSTFAVPTVTGALKRHLRDHTWAVRPPRRLQERYLEVTAVAESLTGELNRFPAAVDIAVRGGWTEREVLEARAQHSCRYHDSWDDADDATRQSGRIDDNYERVEARDLIDDLLATLDDRERHILELRFFSATRPGRYRPPSRIEPDAHLPRSPKQPRHRPSHDGRRHRTPTRAVRSRKGCIVKMKLEVVVLPVADVDRSKSFYETLGFRLDIDYVGSGGFRVVQLTPDGSECSIIVGNKVTSAVPGTVEGLQLVVDDVEAARTELIALGIDVRETFHDAGGVFHHVGNEGRVPGPDPNRRSYGSFASFSDPDGNAWVLQEVTKRAPGR